jgi:GTP-binding protein
MEISFTGSFERLDQLPPPNRPEFAFVGRSNVGKSSLINMLTGRRNLAHTSGTPGKTRLMNLFDVDQTFTIVDLPGYGYARLSKVERERMLTMVRQYLLHREALFLVFLLLDTRISPQLADLSMLDWMGENGIPTALIYTKVEKLKPMEREKNLENYRRMISRTWENLPAEFMTSSVSGEGRDAVLQYIRQCLDSHQGG